MKEANFFHLVIKHKAHCLFQYKFVIIHTQFMLENTI